MVYILVLVDDIELNRSICKSLDGGGYQAKGCTSAMDAFDAMESHRFDLVVLDVMMPGISGREFMGVRREKGKQVPVLFLTAGAEAASKEQKAPVGIDDYMVKPLEMDELVRRVDALLRKAENSEQ